MKDFTYQSSVTTHNRLSHFQTNSTEMPGHMGTCWGLQPGRKKTQTTESLSPASEDSPGPQAVSREQSFEASPCGPRRPAARRVGPWRSECSSCLFHPLGLQLKPHTGLPCSQALPAGFPAQTKVARVTNLPSISQGNSGSRKPIAVLGSQVVVGGTSSCKHPLPP